jgi:hypothetical protein
MQQLQERRQPTGDVNARAGIVVLDHAHDVALVWRQERVLAFIGTGGLNACGLDPVYCNARPLHFTSHLALLSLSLPR